MASVICGYGDHATNKRTLLAWVWTGGFAIEKFKCSSLAMATANAIDG